MDLSSFSDEKLEALKKGDLSSFTDDELNLLKGGAPQPDFETTLSQQTTKVELPQRLQEMKAYLDSSDPTSKEYKKIADAFKTELEINNKMNPKPSNQELDFGQKLAGAGKNVKYAYDVLNQIETSDGDFPFLGSLYGVVQKSGDLMGINPEVGQYESIVNGILSTFARNVGQEKGAMSEGDVDRAKSLFASIYDNKAEREAKKQNAIMMLKNADSSKDWESLFSEPSSFLKSKLSVPVVQSGGMSINQDEIAKALERKRAQRVSP